RRFEARGYVEDVVVVKVQAGDSKSRLRRLRFFHDALRPALPVEFHHPVAFRILDVIGENRGPAPAIRCLLKQRPQAASVEDVVSEHQRRWRVTDKRPPDDKRLRQPFWPRLLSVLKGHPELTSVAQQHLKT